MTILKAIEQKMSEEMFEELGYYDSDFKMSVAMQMVLKYLDTFQVGLNPYFAKRRELLRILGKVARGEHARFLQYDFEMDW